MGWTPCRMCPLIATVTGDRGAFQLSFYFAKTMANELKGDKVTMGLYVYEATISGQWANKFWAGVTCVKSNNPGDFNYSSSNMQYEISSLWIMRNFFCMDFFPLCFFFFFFNLRTVWMWPEGAAHPWPSPGATTGCKPPLLWKEVLLSYRAGD